MEARSTAEFEPRREMTLVEWAALPEDEEGELVDGRLVEEEVPEPEHEAIISWLIGTLRLWVVQRGGFVFGSELKLAVRASAGASRISRSICPAGPLRAAAASFACPPGSSWR